MTPADLQVTRTLWRGLSEDVRLHVTALARRADPARALQCARNPGLERAAGHIRDLRCVIDEKVPAMMDKDRFREILTILGWSQGDVARALGRDSREIRRWAAGQNPIDPDAAAWLEVQAANPPPRRRRAAAETPDRPDTEGFSRS